MEKILLAFFGLTTNVLLAQVDVVNRTVDNRNLPVIYTGIENDIVVTGSEKSLSLKAGSVRKIEKNSFRVIPSVNKYDTIQVVDANNNVVFEKIFEVSYLPAMQVKVQGIERLASPTEIRTNPLLIVDGEFWAERNYSVKAFSVKLVGADNHQLLKVEGNRLPEELLKKIDQLKTDDRVEFRNIELQASDAPSSIHPNMVAVTIR